MMKEAIFGRRKLVLATWICVALLLPVVHATAQTLTPQLGDLILGFRASGAPGQTLNLEVDLGNMSNFYDAAAGAMIPLPGLSVQDLINTYGASWSTRTDLVWGAVASTGRASGTPDGHAVVDTLWATDPAGESAWNRGSTFAQATASEAIEEMIEIGSAGTLYGATSTSNSSEAAVINATLIGSWSAEDLKTAGESFGHWNPTIDSVATIPAGDQVTAQLYELQPTNASGTFPGTFLGNLILTASGLSFRAASGIAPPVAAFSGSPTNGVAPLTVNFTDSSTGSVTGWAWAFGDSNTSTNENPSNTYSNAGSYSVTLTASGPGGSNTLTQTNYVVVLGAVDDVQSYIVAAKGQNYTQSGTNTVTPQANGFDLYTEVQSAGSNAVSSASLQLPGGAITNLIELSNATGFSADEIFASKSLLDSACPTGTYTLTMATVDQGSLASSLSLPADDYPNVPQVLNFTAAQDLDATSAFTLMWATFTGGTTGDSIYVEIDNTAGQIVFQTPNIGQGASLNGTNTSVVIPANTLSPDTNYTGHIMFFHPTATDNVSVPGATGSIGYYQQTWFSLVTIQPEPPAITTTNPLPDGMVGNPYVGTFTATGGTPPYTWSVVSNSLPTGLGLVAGTGAITGTPTVATTASFTVQVEDTNTLVSDETFSLTIDPASTRIISLGGNLAFGAVVTGATANVTLTITNSGNAALTVSSITYPTGFSGAFSGAVPSGGSVNVTVAFAPTAVTSYGGTITVNANQTAGTTTIVASGTGVPPSSRVIGLSGDLAFGNVITGATATASLLVSNTGNTNLTVASISYPSGFSGAFSGVIAPGGTTNVTVTFAPTSVTNYSGIATVTSDATGGTNTLVASGTGVVAPTPPTIITSGLLPTGTVDFAYSQALAATGGATPYQWSVAYGRLPAGLTLSVDGVIGGTPLVATNVSFGVRVTGADGLSSTNSFSLVVLGVTGFVPGRYDGLATFTNSIAGEVIGSVRVVVTKTGAFHAQIKANGTRYIGRGQFDSSGNWTGTLGALSGTLRVDVANTTDQITGTLTGNEFTGSVLANRAFFSAANPPPWVGTYTTLLAGPDDPSIPSGLGWANVQVSSTGWVALKGQLADGSRFNETVPISKYGTWPLYDTPNGLYSLVGGWVAMTNASVAFETGSMLSDVNGDLFWYRPAIPTSHVFPAGFTTELTLVGSSYTIPAPGTTILPVTDNTCNTFVVFGGGSLTVPVTNTVTLTMTDRIINCSGGTLSLSVNPSRGAFTGSYVLPGTTKPVSISGLFLQNGSVGGGSFFEGNTTGYVTIEPLIEPAP